MKAKIARAFGGHPFESTYTNMNEAQTAILYRYLLEEEAKHKTESRALVKEVLEVAFKQFKFYFDEVQLFINAKLFKRKKEFEDRVKQDLIQPPDVTADNFEEVWESLKNIVPMEVEVDFSEEHNLLDEQYDPEFTELLAGWLDKKEGGVTSGDE